MKTLLLATLLLAQFSVQLMAQTAATNSSAYNLDSGKQALQGYDPVAYFTEKAAVKGQPTIHHTHDGVKYYFNTAANRDAFVASPQRYMPAYGGWCATAMAKGEKVEIDPKNFKVTNDRLFLFFNAWYGDAKKAWVKDEPAQITLADTNWKKISGEN